VDRLVQLLINAAALFVAVFLVPGLDFAFEPENAWLKFLLVAFIFGLVNTFVRPILRIVTFPITMITLGLFLLVINALLLLLTDWIAGKLDVTFYVESFGWAVLGAIVISIVNAILGTVAKRA
jgi:putative membrane protein